MKQILVMGGAGYIGSHAVKHLTEQGYSCVVADNLICGHREAVPAGVPFEKADLNKSASLEKLFRKYDFEAVLHFAAFAAVGESVIDPQKYYHNNVVGTLNLLAAMKNHGVQKIVFSSTCATYGEPQYTPMDEKHPQHPINPYGRTKLMIEQTFADYAKAYGLKYIALRYFNAAGAAADGAIGEAHNPETHLIPIVLEAISGKRTCLKIFGTDYPTPDGTCLRDYIHVEDLAEAHRLALEKLDEYSGYINLGTGVKTSVKEIVTAAEKVTGKKCPVQIAPRREGDPAELYAANGKAEEVLGWKPHYLDIEKIIETAWNWEKNRRY